MDTPKSDKVGILCAVSAYSMWALATVYFKALSNLNAFEILSHRIVGSSILAIVFLTALHRLGRVMCVVADKKKLIGLLASTVLIAANWTVFIWSIGEGKILDASLGYYINPLVNILLGFLFLGERLNTIKMIATSLCVFAVVLEIINFGAIPYIALFLATTFGFYGLVRKKLGVDSMIGLGIETTLLMPLALVYLFISPNDAARFIGSDLQQTILLLLAGPVTMLPLLCFSAAANRISLSLMGFIQYLAPTGMFFLAIYAYGETASAGKLLTFTLVWGGIALLLIEALWSSRRYLRKRTDAGAQP